MMTKQRRVIGPGGSMVMKSFPAKSKSVESPTTKEPEQNLDQSTEIDTVVVNEKRELTIPMIKAMEPQELRVVATELKLKLGNVKKKAKMQDKLIKELGLEEDVL